MTTQNARYQHAQRDTETLAVANLKKREIRWAGDTRRFVGKLNDNTIAYEGGYSTRYMERWTTLNLALAAFASNAIDAELSTTFTLTGDTIIPATLAMHVKSAGRFALNGFTLTIRGPFSAGNHAVFTGVGSVVFDTGVLNIVNPKWFSAALDGTTDDGAAINKCQDALPYGGIIDFPVCKCLIGTPVVLSNYQITLRGKGNSVSLNSQAATMFLAKAAMNSDAITVTGTDVILESFSLDDQTTFNAQSAAGTALGRSACHGIKIIGSRSQGRNVAVFRQPLDGIHFGDDTTHYNMNYWRWENVRASYNNQDGIHLGPRNGNAAAPPYSATATAGSANTITFPAGASAVTDFYKNRGISLTGGTGSGQINKIIAYNGTTKVATIGNTYWTTPPDATTTFTVAEGGANGDLNAGLLDGFNCNFNGRYGLYVYNAYDNTFTHWDVEQNKSHGIHIALSGSNNYLCGDVSEANGDPANGGPIPDGNIDGNSDGTRNYARTGLGFSPNYDVFEEDNDGTEALSRNYYGQFICSDARFRRGTGYPQIDISGINSNTPNVVQNYVLYRQAIGNITMRGNNGEQLTVDGIDTAPVAGVYAGKYAALVFRDNGVYQGEIQKHSTSNDIRIVDKDGAIRLRVVQSSNTILGAPTGQAVQVSGVYHLLAAATTSYPSQRIPTGTAPTSPTVGDVIHDSTRKTMGWYASSGIWQYLVGKIFAKNADVTLANSVVETSLFDAGVGTKQLPANSLTPGKSITVRVSGFFSTTGTPTLRIKAKLNSVVVMDTTAVATASGVSNGIFWHEFRITCRSTGVSGTVHGQGMGYHGAVQVPSINTAVVVVDTTIAQTLDVLATWGTASSSNTLTATDGNIIVEM